MHSLPTLPRPSWIDRILFAFAAVLSAIGIAGLAGWWLHIDLFLMPWNAEPIQAAEALSFFVLGAVVIARELGWRSAGWFGLAAVGLAAVMLLESAFNRDWHVSDFFLIDRLAGTGAHPGRSATITGACIGIGALIVVWHSAHRAARARMFTGAVTGSLLAAVGFSTLLGYVADLPALYNWGSLLAIAPLAAVALFLLGLILLALAWRESLKEKNEPPAWAPLPAVIGCLTLTMILWTGLRDREHAYLNAKTLQTMGTLAAAIDSRIETEKSELDSVARIWSDSPENDTVIWDTDARKRLQASSPYGCESIAYVDDALRTRWIYPQAGNEWALNFNHLSVGARKRHAIKEALDPMNKNRPAISGTTSINGGAERGFVVYAPIVRHARVAGFVAAEYNYAAFFKKVADDFSGILNYHVTIAIGADSYYDSGPARADLNAGYTIDRTYWRSTAFEDRHLELTFTPSDELVSSGSGSLPEFALAAGVGLTALLGLSVHLARRARAGQLAAEISNRRLLAENEERRRVETRLKISDERLRLALDSTEIGIFEWNVATGHVYYSNGLWAMLGYEHDRMPGTLEAWQSLIHPDDLALYRPRVESQLNGAATFIDLEYRIRTRTGDWRWIYGRSKSISTDSQGRPARIIGTVQDVTARVETEHQLRRAKAEADATSRAKSEFLASMSHEIRTPMNGIIGMTSLIGETTLSAEQRDYVATIRSSSEALLSIVNDILDFSKIESGKMEIERMPFGLALCLEETLDLFAVKAAEKNIEIGYCLARDVPPWITGDITRLWQVITNLVNNAVKFTAAGSVSVEVQRGAPAAEGRFFLEFTVRDTGIGIPPDRLNRLFKAFSQVDSSTTRKYGGTGLGLAISQRLSLLMGGNIRVESEVGKGSAFIFNILTAAAPLPIDIDYLPALPDQLRGGTVLCVEDHPVTQARLRGLLDKWGVTCVISPTLAAAGEIAAGLAVEPVLLVVDHGAIGDRPRSMRSPRLTGPLLVMVPFGQNLPATTSENRPFATVTKPLKDAAFMHAVTTLFSVIPEEEADVIPSDTHVLAQEIPLRVLLAEDNPVNQKVALGYLERMGYHADLVGNGRPGRGDARDPQLRPGADGPADARDGRPGGQPPDPPPPAGRAPAEDHRAHRQCHGGRPRAVHCRRHGRLHFQAGQTERNGRRHPRLLPGSRRSSRSGSAERSGEAARKSASSRARARIAGEVSHFQRVLLQVEEKPRRPVGVEDELAPGRADAAP